MTLMAANKRMRHWTGSLALAMAILTAGCASVTPTVYRPESDNRAVMSLLERARSDAANGAYATAEASLERALRIEPGNAYLWYEMAHTALQQGRAHEAENFALRADSLAGRNPALKEDAWRLVAQSRAVRGDETGAQQALRKAGQY